MSKESSPYSLRSQSRSLTPRRVHGSTSKVRSRSQVSSGSSTPAPVLSSSSTISLTMTKFDAMFPGVGTPCSGEDIAKEMATLTKANCLTGKARICPWLLPLWNSSLELLMDSLSATPVARLKMATTPPMRLQTSSQTMAASCAASWIVSYNLMCRMRS